MQGFTPIQFLYIVIAVSMMFLVTLAGTLFIASNKLSEQSTNKPSGTLEQETRSTIINSSTTDESTPSVRDTSEPDPDSNPNQLQNSPPIPEVEAPDTESLAPADSDTADTEVQPTNNVLDAPTTITQIEIIEETELPSLSFSDINISTREAVVNIFCTTKGGGPFNPTSGSGVIIDERGVILTNAHIAQYFLLKDYPSKDFVDCIIRTGSPAQARFRASLLFIPTIWVETNAEKIAQQNPRSNGENDFALLLIKESVRTDSQLPSTFSSVNPILDETVVNENESVLLAGYPAGFLGGIAIQKNLYITSTITDIEKVFTFKENTLDLFSLGGNIIAQQGVSGGAVINKENGLIGIFVTSSDGETTDERDLRAITLSHINRSLILNSEMTLEELLAGDLLQKTLDFSANTAPALTKLLVDVLE